MTEAVHTLCRACGLCCDGSLFGRAQLDPDEVTVAKKNRLRVVENEGSFEQRCSAFVEGTCAVYEERPRTCRRFVCRLAECLRASGGDDVAPYLERVRRVRELLGRVDAAGDVPPELATSLDEDFARA